MKVKQRILRRCPLLFALLAVSLLCAGCGDKAVISNADFADAAPGNTNANLNNLGLTVVQGDIPYFIGSVDDYDIIYKGDENAAPTMAITGITGYIQFLNLVDDTFYFVGVTYDDSGAKTEAIFCAPMDNDEKKCLYTAKAGQSISYMTVINNLVFYVASEESGSSTLYAVNIKDNTEAKLLVAANHIRYLNICNGKLYYIEENTIYTANIDGQGSKALYSAENWLGNLVVTDDEAFFAQADTEQSDGIYRLKLNGGEPQKLHQGKYHIDHLNINDDTLFFTDDRYDKKNQWAAATVGSIDLFDNTIAKLGKIEQSYSGIEVCNDLLIYHINDDSFTAKTIKLSK